MNSRTSRINPQASQPDWQRLDHEARRQRIVDEAMALLFEEGYPALTMRKLASRIGVGTMTIYTYISGQEQLHQEMIRQGFRMLRSSCQGCSALPPPTGGGQSAARQTANASSMAPPGHGWRGSARAYIQFALDHPRLYQLMFATPIADNEEVRQMLEDEFAPMRERIREQIAHEQRAGNPADEDRAIRRAATQYWIALHGLASLAIAERLPFLYGTLDEVLDDLLERVAPTR